MAAAAIFTGCKSEPIVLEGKGSLTIDADCETDYREIVTKSSQTEEEILNGLTVSIVRPYDGWRVNYASFADIRGKIIELGSGLYTISVASPEKRPAAYDQPIYEGVQDFEIKTGEVTSVDLICSIMNAKVSVILTDTFASELSDYTVTVDNGSGALLWTKADDVNDFTAVEENGVTVHKGIKSGFFSVAPLTVTVDGHRNIDGSAASTVYHINKVNPADHHILRLDAKVTGSIGGLNITVSDALNEIDQPVVVPGFDEKPVEGDDNTGDGEDGDDGSETPDVPPVTDGPKLIWEANPDFADTDLPMSMEAQVSVELVIEAPKGIKEFLIFVDSKVLTPTIAALTEAGEAGIVEGVATMDMINDATLFGNLGETLPMGDAVKDQTSVNFSLSGLVPMINMYAGDITPGDKHTFTLKVVDGDGNILEQPVTFVSVPAE